MNRLFETKTKADVPNEPDAQIIFHDRPYISYPQIILDNNFLDTSMVYFDLVTL